MGLCHEFGSQIRDGCNHPMRAGATACSCAECGVVCRGLFDGCPDVWARGPRPVAISATRASAANGAPSAVATAARPRPEPAKPPGIGTALDGGGGPTAGGPEPATPDRDPEPATPDPGTIAYLEAPPVAIGPGIVGRPSPDSRGVENRGGGRRGTEEERGAGRSDGDRSGSEDIRWAPGDGRSANRGAGESRIGAEQGKDWGGDQSARPDAGRPGVGSPRVGGPDTGRPDTGRPDAGRPDAGRPDAGRPDSGRPDSGRPDSGRPETGRPGVGRVTPGDPRQEVFRWFEEAFEGVRVELQALIGSMTHQQAMLAELLDSRQAELRLALVAESLPDLVADAVRAAMDEHTAAMAGSFDRSHERFKDDIDQIRADTAATVESLSDSFEKLSDAIAIHDEEAEQREAARLSVLKGSVTRQFTPLAEAVAVLAAKIDDLGDQVAAPGRAPSTRAQPAPASAFPARPKGAAAARNASPAAKPAVGQRVSSARMKGAATVDDRPASQRRVLTGKVAPAAAEESGANGAAASPLARRVATSRTASTRIASPARPATGRAATTRTAATPAAAIRPAAIRPAAAARPAASRVATARETALTTAAASAAARPVAARVAAAKAARAARAPADAASDDDPATAPARDLTGPKTPASSVPAEPLVVYELETEEEDEDIGWAPPAWVSAATGRPAAEQVGPARAVTRSGTSRGAVNPRSTRTPG